MGMPIAYMDAKSLPKGKKTIILYIGPSLSSNLEPGPSANLETNLKIYKNLEFQTLPQNFGALVRSILRLGFYPHSPGSTF
jgi:hypothetical protein